MKNITVYGKGGVGKSMVCSTLSVTCALKGLRMLQIGCDPKADSTILLRDGARVDTVLDILEKSHSGLNRGQVVTRGRHGIDCIESGGPEPGMGCGGRGVSRMLEVVRDLNVLDGRYDAVVFDVLGDLVCGGFAAPLRLGFGEIVVIVASEELMALYAANNITKIVNTYSPNGVALGGIVVNLRDNDTDRDALAEFADRLNTRIIGFVPRSKQIRKAEIRGKTVVEMFPDSEEAAKFREIADYVLSLSVESLSPPTPMPGEELMKFFRDRLDNEDV